MNGLLFITHQTKQYTSLQSIEIALLGGCRQIQLRMKGCSLAEIESIAQKAKSLCDAYRAQLYINDHVEICMKVKAAGLHLGKNDRSPADARTILGHHSIIGGTANTFNDIQYMQSQGVDYIGLGPFRFTSTKQNLSPVLGLNGYAEIMSRCKESRIDIPVLAIGGITLKDIPSVLQTGVAGIALSSAILNAANPVEETERIIELINKYQTCRI
ncbi:MAG: thiamine phosphate synthase [Tannerella sp.]|nr:thiamine phosphate synthase [Tannerella sp.]